VALTWVAPTFTAGLTRYRVTPNQVGVGPLAAVFTPGTGTSFTVVGLVNGTQYQFSVAAEYGAGQFSAESALSAIVVPGGKFITQTITVTRPVGGLVLTQACAGSDPYPDTNPPVGDVLDVVYPTDCTIDLGTATLIKTGAQAGQYFRTTGSIRQVTVVDTRDTDPGWVLNGQVSNFTSGPTKTFSANDLGWTPVVTDRSAPFTSPDGSYAMQVTAGAAIPPGLAGGLGSPRTLATGAVGTGTAGGLGITHLDASLELLIPIFAKSGTYVAVLTLTAI
jgi:hypothetical protein